MSTSSPLARAILDALRSDPDACAELRGLLNIEPPQPAPQEDGWLDGARAAAYLDISRNALHKHTAARTIPFEQDRAGCKCWFKRSDLDAWRTGPAAKTQPRASKRNPHDIA